VIVAPLHLLGVGPADLALGDPGLEREDARRPGLAVGHAGQGQQPGDMGLVLGAQGGHPRRAVEVVVAVGMPSPPSTRNGA